MPIAIRVFILPILRKANQGENMKTQKHKQPARPLGGVIDYKKREAERRMALRLAVNVNATIDLVSPDERVILGAFHSSAFGR